MVFNLAIILCCVFEGGKHTSSLRSLLGHYSHKHVISLLLAKSGRVLQYIYIVLRDDY